MKLKTFISLSLLLVGALSFAQNLKRKAFFGVAYYQSIPDSIATSLKLTSTAGALVKLVVPNSTAEALKLQTNDLIVKINNQAITNGAEFLKKVQSLQSGENIAVTVLRNNKSISSKSIVKGRPKEVSATADILYDDFKFDNGYIRTILKQPKSKKTLGTIFYLQGISCYSIDNLQPNDPTKHIIDGFIERGYAVYLVEKAGMGDSNSPTPCQAMGFKEELSLFREGYKKLLSYKTVDTSDIILLGHSLGGIVAPLLAQEFQPKGVVVYGTGLRPWSDYLLEVIKIQYQAFGSDLANLQDTIELVKPTLYDFFYSSKNSDDLLKDPKKLWALQEGLGYDTLTHLCFAGRSMQYHKELNTMNVAKAWKNINSHVLTMYGEADIAALYPDDHIAIVDYVNKNHPGKATYKGIAKTNHTMQEIGTMQDYINMQSDPVAYEKFASEHFNYKVLDEICDWVKAIN